LDELGIQLNEDLNKLPTAGEPVANKEAQKQPQATAVGSDIDADLQARLENLRRE
jgi:hypothetical protein